MRLIDADALKGEKFYSHERHENCVSVYAIDTMPTIEPERPHGEWEHWGSPFTDDTIANSIVCSLCKARYVEIDGEVFNFCPNCGADMRKKEGEENE